MFHNTVVAPSTGISVTGGASGFTQQVKGNAVFAGSPIRAGDSRENITDSYGAADLYLVNPGGSLQGDASRLDLYPRAGMLTGPTVDMGELENFLDWNEDFNGDSRSGSFRGAYSGDDVNPGWQLSLTRKPEL